MDGEPEAETPEAERSGAETPEPGQTPTAAGAATRSRPAIDVSPALHEAGHEVVDLGFEGIPDSGPVLHPEREHPRPDDPLDFVNLQIPSD